ncbi:SPOR domain-containing protein [Vibrio tritonius]|uniref:SPOR domain-containing protein n=1 Tax=Vibrio tritonius TaxID=1435069 RepID=UPI00315DC10D
MENTPRFPLAWLLSFSLAAAPFAMPSAVQAQDFLCDAHQASGDELPVLDKSCPIGRGLWGNSKPKDPQAQFWIQCGLLDSRLPLETAKPLYRQITTDVWLKPEGKSTRCLIGPYKDFAKAQADLTRVKTLPKYKNAFIREVSQKMATTPVAPKPRTKASTTTTTKMLPEVKPAVTRVVVPKNANKTNTRKVKPQKIMPSIRRQTVINGLDFALPYVNDEAIQFYMEWDLPWNRLNYDDAEKMCSTIKMRLATENEWKQLLDSQVMEAEKWPMNLPYWGWNKKGLFTNGKTTTLKGSSLLNVICVFKRS